MKNKIIALVVSLSFFVSLVGCDGLESSTSSSKESKKSPEVTHSVSFNKNNLGRV